jgi:hypothetical protein
MTEENKEGQEKPRYEAPELLSLGETVRGVAVCQAGSTPSGTDEYCTDGAEVFEFCIDGEFAYIQCAAGYDF